MHACVYMCACMFVGVCVHVCVCMSKSLRELVGDSGSGWSLDSLINSKSFHLPINIPGMPVCCCVSSSGC